MITSKAPQRISLGSAADTIYFLEKIPDGWGNALSIAITRYNYCSIVPTPNGISISSAFTSPPRYYSSLAEIEDSFPKSGRPLDMIEAAIMYFRRKFGLSLGKSKGFHIVSSGDTPPESGLGGSAASMVSIIYALSLFSGVNLSREQIVRAAYTIERSPEYLNIPGGVQDQVAAVFGGINYMVFRKNGNEIDFEVYPLRISNELIERLLLVRIPRESSGMDIHIEQRIKSQTDPNIPEILAKKRQNVENLRTALENRMNIGPYLLEDMRLKSQLGSVETDVTRRIFERALDNGALGGRIIGAGRGGCMIFYCEDREKVLKSLKEYGVQEIKFEIDYEGVRGEVYNL
jgi:D-glycero-alpha-D-manno-heptose-7-phosphate kinase